MEQKSVFILIFLLLTFLFFDLALMKRSSKSSSELEKESEEKCRQFCLTQLDDDSKRRTLVSGCAAKERVLGFPLIQGFERLIYELDNGKNRICDDYRKICFCIYLDLEKVSRPA